MQYHISQEMVTIKSVFNTETNIAIVKTTS